MHHGAILCVLLALGLVHANAAVSQDYMGMSLEELMATDVSVASRVSLRADRQPAAVTTISAAQIRHSGARTLNELLMIHVPGFFLVEDQDDTIAGVRGLAPDNNSKLLLLLDGVSLNADWFWGPPDAVLNGLDLAFIERLEVIRGPGSVTLGQGALLGVVNIVTRGSRSHATLVAGEDGRTGAALRHRWRWNDWLASLYLSDGRFEGEPYRNEGLGLQVEQGLSVFERNHHLRRGDYGHLMFDLDDGRWSLRAFRFQQRRDLYNWRRDRERVEQRLDGLVLGYRHGFARGEAQVELFHQIDDYELSSHGGTRAGAARSLIPGMVLGGHRESRSALRAQFRSDSLLDGHRIALGAEWTRLHAGQRNARGNNFLVNTQQAVLDEGPARLNRFNRWSLPGRTRVMSLFAEDFIDLGSGWELFLAARWDDHPDWGSEVSPRLGLLFQNTPEWRWRLSWQTGFRGAVGVNYSGGFEGDGLLREANFGQVESNPFFAANGNRNLRPVSPEKSSSLELAAGWHPSVNWQVEATLFYNVTRNVIGVGAYFIADDVARAEAVAAATRIGSDVIGDWGGVFYFQNNPGSLHHAGLELEAEYRLDELGLTLRASHSRVEVTSSSAGQFGPGNIYVAGRQSSPLARSFPERVNRLQAEWRPGGREGALSLHASLLDWPHWYPPVQENADGSSFTPELDGNTVLNLGLGYRFVRLPGWSIALQLKNVGNALALYPATSVAGEGEGNLGVPALERRSGWVTLRVDF
ncbi:TonB-dependent receptor plug domain-containing protein [Pseudomarimonas salicorniae]|uniref:TonB-dependent receptor n=1 Tax=Pseudomarimonas salicorniae TaxID=2933270 RepID=A0ABT0GFI6_9GAMM|nr:TonB-dependent receptor [Lysobacter sp. CAU 1642]MCK7593299.1 TonB-dependent receptor [Lysobacter sp. CAU 1642]